MSSTLNEDSVTGYFLAAATAIVGEDNIKLYLKKFSDLDHVYFEDIKNYEALAFYIYSTSMGWHIYINEQLWSDNPDPAVKIFKNVLNGALKKLPTLKGSRSTVYRGYNTADLARFTEDYPVGKIIIFKGFTSSAYQAGSAFGGNILFIIRSRSACSIWHLASDYHEYEALIPAGKEFLVVDSVREGSKAVIVIEEQSDEGSVEKREFKGQAADS